jgi:hypothetical protein
MIPKEVKTKILWAAMAGMVLDIHTAMDQLTAEEWELAEQIFNELDQEVNELDQEICTP